MMLFHQPKNSVSNYNYNTAFYTDEIWENHFHKNLELIYVINGNVSCRVYDTEYNLSAGDFGLCLPYDIHSYIPKVNTSYFVLVFSEDFVHLFSKQMSDKTSDGFIFRPEEAVKRYVLQQLIYNDNLTIYTLKSCLYALCEEYLKCVRVIKKDITHNNIVVDVIDYIEKNHTKKFALSDLAKNFGYDYNYMSRLFKNHFNMPFVDFVNIYRIETALNLLERTDKSISEIAFDCGFQSVRNFHHCFKKMTNCTPLYYKKKSQNEDSPKSSNFFL